jgi:hypothetical protein
MRTTLIPRWSFAALALAVASLSSLPAATTNTTGAAKSTPPAKAPEVNDAVKSVTIERGALRASIDGSLVGVTNEIAFPKKIVISTNGTFALAGGKQRALGEGQVLDRDGNLTSPDGSIVPVEDHLQTIGGRVFVTRDGDTAPLTKDLLLSNGTRISPDGRMVTSRNLIKRLLDGQILKLSDNGVEATDTAQLENGKVVLFKDGGRIELRPGQVMAMSDGSRVDSSGVVTRPDGSRVSLSDGALYKFDGATGR